jgi:hypothetical protein
MLAYLSENIMTENMVLSTLLHYSLLAYVFFFTKTAGVLPLHWGNRKQSSDTMSQPELKRSEKQKESLKKLDNTQAASPVQNSPETSENRNQKGVAGEDQKLDTSPLRKSTPAGQDVQDWPLNKLPDLESFEVKVNLLFSRKHNLIFASWHGVKDAHFPFLPHVPPAVKEHSGCSSEIATDCFSCI